MEGKMEQIQALNFEDKTVRTISRDGEMWWVLKDVCDVLEISNSRDTTARLDEDEKGVAQIYTPGGQQEMTIISESGLYNVILRSDKPKAKPFRKWVTSEVLPAIRKTGVYSVHAIIKTSQKSNKI
jgi:anti-repressor protein